MNVMHVESYEQMSRIAANIIWAQIVLKPECVLGLATGSTPVGIYKRLVELHRNGELDFSRATTVNLDEYCGLDGGHPQSYRFFMNRQLFDHVNIDKARTHVPDGVAADPQTECRRYDVLIQSLGGIDLQLLGIGHNGHIGFNEPGAEFCIPTHVVELTPSTIKANSRFFASDEEVPKRAITMGMGAIMAARKVVLAVSGADKRDILEKALYGPVTPQIPASLLQLHPDLTVVCCVG